MRLTANNRILLFCGKCHDYVTVINGNDYNTNFLQAYYGGEARCEEQAGGGDVYDPKELVCGGCSDVSRAQVGYLYVLMSLMHGLVTCIF